MKKLRYLCVGALAGVLVWGGMVRGDDPEDHQEPAAEATPAAEDAPATEPAPEVEDTPKDAGNGEPTPEVADSDAADEPRSVPETDSRLNREMPEGGWKVYVVPIRGPIASPQLYILRRALKEAISNQVDVVLLDMDTPGGELGVTLEMMEALARFEGLTITFVNDEAVSAGSYIAIATDDIYFSPRGVMGAAEAVAGGGQDIPEAMQRKINSYLQARVRVLSGTHRYRAQVQRAMMDPNYVLEIDGRVLKEKGELLTLTAPEAMETFGDPPQPLLAAGIVANETELLDRALGAGNYQVRQFEVTWSEHFALWFKSIAPVLLGIGFLMLFIEMKTPGFGVIGGVGIGLLLLVFASNYFAGMAGNEEVLVFLLGIILLAVEIFLFPGTLVFGITGVVMIIGSLLWAMADIWPGEAFEITPELFYVPVLQLFFGFGIAGIGLAVLGRFLPKTRFWGSIVLEPSLAKTERSLRRDGQGNPTADLVSELPPPGSEGLAVTDLRPLGLVEIDGHRYEARGARGFIAAGTTIKVIGRQDYALVVQSR